MIAQREPERWATCPWCRRTVPLDQAIDEGRCPEWWDGDTGHSSPACATCAAEHLERAPDGEMTLRPGHPLPEGER